MTYLEYVDAPTDGSDATAAIQAAINAGGAILRLGATYSIDSLTAVEGSGIYCPAGRATLAKIGTGNKMLTIGASDFHVKGVNFVGASPDGNFAVSTASVGTKHAIWIEDTHGQIKNVTLTDCEIYGFNGHGVYVGHLAAASTYGKSLSAHNVDVHNCYGGFVFVSYAEYCLLSNCSAWKNYCGVYVGSGNNKFSTCNFNANFRNCWLDPGSNNSHGGFVGCGFNHAATGGKALYANGIQYGELFTSCHFWYGDIYINNCTGVIISKSQLANLSVQIIGGSGNSVEDNWTNGNVTITRS